MYPSATLRVSQDKERNSWGRVHAEHKQADETWFWQRSQGWQGGSLDVAYDSDTNEHITEIILFW